MSRVSVVAGQKPKPKESFKFLRRDEGRLSYATAVAESPSKGGSATPRVNAERRDSRALREAIAYDMKNGRSHDPFGEVVIAVPKRAPPPNQEAAAAAGDKGAPASRRTAPRASSKLARPEWVEPGTPARREEAPPTSRSEPRSIEGYGDAYHQEGTFAPTASAGTGSGEYQPYSSRGGPASIAPDPSPGSNGRLGVADISDSGYDRYSGGAAPAGPPRRTASAPRRYVDPAYDDYDRNYFRRTPPPANRDYSAAPPLPARSRAEDDLMLQLEQEVRAAQDERARYTYAQQQLDREKQRFESFRFTTQQQLDEERAELDSLRMKEQRSAQKDVKAFEERYRNVSGLLSTEREANRKLMQENDSLRHQLEELTAAMREQQKTHKAETARLRRDVESLTNRNADLLAMTKDQQAQRMDAVAAAAAASRSQPRTVSASSISSLQRDPSVASTARQPLSLPQRAQLSPPPLRTAAAPAVERPAYHDDSASGAEETEEPDDEVDLYGDHESSGAATSHGGLPPAVVMDFTPRGKLGAAAERRATETEERLRRAEDEAQRRRQQRDREAEERRAQQLAEAEQRTRERETCNPPEEAAAARKAAGHPARTPRGAATESSTSPAAKKKAAGNAAAAANDHRTAVAGGLSSVKPTEATRRATQQAPPASVTEPRRKPSVRIPSRRELLGDSEGMPSEDFANDEIVSQTALGDNPNKREILYQSGKREIHYTNGTRKIVLPSGHTILHFTNGDVKCTYPSGKSTYWYDAAQTTHTQNPDGVQVFEFNATGQTERHLTDGTKEILYPDGIFKVVKPDGTDETYFPEDQ